MCDIINELDWRVWLSSLYDLLLLFHMSVMKLAEFPEIIQLKKYF